MLMNTLQDIQFLDKEFYLPNPENLAAQSIAIDRVEVMLLKENKQKKF